MYGVNSVILFQISILLIATSVYTTSLQVGVGGTIREEENSNSILVKRRDLSSGGGNNNAESGKTKKLHMNEEFVFGDEEEEANVGSSSKNLNKPKQLASAEDPSLKLTRFQRTDSHHSNRKQAQVDVRNELESYFERINERKKEEKMRNDLASYLLLNGYLNEEMGDNSNNEGLFEDDMNLKELTSSMNGLNFGKIGGDEEANDMFFASSSNLGGGKKMSKVVDSASRHKPVNVVEVVEKLLQESDYNKQLKAGKLGRLEEEDKSNTN